MRVSVCGCGMVEPILNYGTLHSALGRLLPELDVDATLGHFDQGTTAGTTGRRRSAERS